MNKRTGLVLAAITLVILGAVGWWVYAMYADKADKPHAVIATPSIQASATVMPKPDVSRLEQSLNTSDRTKQGAALTAGVRKLYLGQKQPLLPAGTKISLKADTFVTNGTVATLQADVSPGGTYILHLYRENGTWSIVYTEAQ